MTANTIIRTAESYLGTIEKPINNVIFNTEYYGREVSGSVYPWCCVFIWYVFKKSGAEHLFFDGKKTAYCPTLLNWAKQKCQTVQKPQKGDVVFFNFNGKTRADHVGLVEAVSPNGDLLTIEGNTSAVNNTNGGEVAQRNRKMKNVVGIWRPAYSSEKEVPMPAKTTVPEFKPYAAVVNVNSFLNVRTTPAVASNNYFYVNGSRFMLPKGMVVAIDSENNGFGKLSNINGWVSLQYLQK